MFFFNCKKRIARDEAIEAEIQRVRTQTLTKIDKATKSVERVNTLLAKTDIKDYTRLIYSVTGGDRR